MELLDSGSLVANRYRVEYLAGCGSQAKVYCCTDIRLGTLQVALKVFSLSTTNPKNIVVEIQAVTRVNHDNVVRLYEVCCTPTFLALVIEWCPGKNLLEFIAEFPGPVPIARCLNILRQMASALDAIHKKGVLHRDLKPENILILPDDLVKISDFGVAELCDSTEDSHNSPRTGTPQFLPLEYLEQRSFNKASDLYAFGICAYELLTKQPAFNNSDQEKLLQEKRMNSPKDPSALRPDCPTILAELCIHCTSEVPSLRPESASVIVTTLRTLLAGLESTPFLDSPLSTQERRKQRSAIGELLNTPTPLLHLSLGQLIVVSAILFFMLWITRHLHYI